MEHGGKTEALWGCTWLLVAWGLHYFPFFAMGRILYFHHYLPAFVCSAMLAGIFFDYIIVCLQRFFNRSVLFRITLTAIVLSTLLFGHYLFSCMSYGMHWPLRHYKWIQWLPSWEIA
jgi:dolichyl-phosphate-mannose-protein mannosyltransferase